MAVRQQPASHRAHPYGRSELATEGSLSNDLGDSKLTDLIVDLMPQEQRMDAIMLAKKGDKKEKYSDIFSLFQLCEHDRHFMA